MIDKIVKCKTEYMAVSSDMQRLYGIRTDHDFDCGVTIIEPVDSSEGFRPIINKFGNNYVEALHDLFGFKFDLSKMGAVDIIEIPPIDENADAVYSLMQELCDDKDSVVRGKSFN